MYCTDAPNTVPRFDAVRAEMAERSQRIIFVIGRSSDFGIGGCPVETILRRLGVRDQFARDVQVLAKKGIEWKEDLSAVTQALHFFAAINRAGHSSQIGIEFALI
jgi:hypothetical protein